MRHLLPFLLFNLHQLLSELLYLVVGIILPLGLRPTLPLLLFLHSQFILSCFHFICVYCREPFSQFRNVNLCLSFHLAFFIQQPS